MNIFIHVYTVTTATRYVNSRCRLKPNSSLFWPLVRWRLRFLQKTFLSDSIPSRSIRQRPRRVFGQPRSARLKEESARALPPAPLPYCLPFPWSRGQHRSALPRRNVMTAYLALKVEVESVYAARVTPLCIKTDRCNIATDIIQYSNQF